MTFLKSFTADNIAELRHKPVGDNHLSRTLHMSRTLINVSASVSVSSAAATQAPYNNFASPPNANNASEFALGLGLDVDLANLPEPALSFSSMTRAKMNGFIKQKVLKSARRNGICPTNLLSVADNNTRKAGFRDRAAYLNKLDLLHARDRDPKSVSSANQSCRFRHYGEQVIDIDAANFARALEYLWELGAALISSIRARLHDITDTDASLFDAFFTFVDVFVLTHYDRSESTCDMRPSVLHAIDEFQKRRKQLELDENRDPLLCIEVLRCANKARTLMMRVAYAEASGRWYHVEYTDFEYVDDDDSAGRMVRIVFARAAAIRRHRSPISRWLRAHFGSLRGFSRAANRVNDLERIAHAFRVAEQQYRNTFSSAVHN